MALTYKLTYFEVKGAAECIRYLFHYGGIEFEDNRIPYTQWGELKPKMPFGQLPILEHNGKTINQSVPICRHVAKLVALRGKDDWEDLEIDAFVDTVRDFRQNCSKFFYGPEAGKAAEKEKILKETLPFYCERFNKSAKNGYLIGGHLTWADLYFASVIDTFTGFLQTDLNNYPNLQAVKNNVESIPAIKAWITKRPEDIRPRLN